MFKSLKCYCTCTHILLLCYEGNRSALYGFQVHHCADLNSSPKTVNLVCILNMGVDSKG